MDNAELVDRLRRIEQQIGEIRELVKGGHSKADILVAVHAAREVLAWFGSAVIGDSITEELATTAASEDPNTRSQRLEALLDSDPTLPCDLPAIYNPIHSAGPRVASSAPQLA